MNSKVLVDSEAFKIRFEEVASQAKKSIYVQAMSFEGDSSGEWLIDCLIKSNAPDIKLCLDSYSKFVINDHFVLSLKYFRDREFREEIINTKRLIKKAKEHGIGVKYTNPLGFLFLKYPLRNHKKMVVVDDEIAYLGGINFCDHNFEWHDMMIELQDSSLGSALSNDVQETFSGFNQSVKCNSGNSSIYFLDGLRSKSLYDDIFRNIKNAKKSIRLFSPYVSDPLLKFVRENVDSSVELDIISPAINNKSIFKKILLNELKDGYFTFMEYQERMSHLKAIIIDDSILIAGSSNFDFVSYFFEQEVVLVSENEGLIKEFIEKVEKPDIKNSLPLGVSEGKVDLTLVTLFQWIGKLSHFVAWCIVKGRILRKKYKK
ncbi:MAG: phosphatidylserine/phosphatidylglycerophosphate/cardiolipin synthase family protein [Reichenbachiella sp.]